MHYRPDTSSAERRATCSLASFQGYGHQVSDREQGITTVQNASERGFIGP